MTQLTIDDGIREKDEPSKVHWVRSSVCALARCGRIIPRGSALVA
jgi:hypothetical protein